MGCAIGPESCGNCAALPTDTAYQRLSPGTLAPRTGLDRSVCVCVLKCEIAELGVSGLAGCAPERADIFDALDSLRGHVHAELLVAEHGEALLE
eukprot:2305412-Rhodomonas_salina.2